MRCSVGFVDGQLAVDDLYQTAHAPLAFMSIFTRFGDMSSRIMVVSQEVKVGRSM